MNLSTDDKALLEELCNQCNVSYCKVIKLLDTSKEFELKDRRIGIYDALREILKTNFTEEESKNEV